MQKNRTIKRAALVLLLLAALLLLSACHVDTDRIVDTVDIGNGTTQGFDTVLMPTPTVAPATPVPTAAPAQPTSNTVDWSQWAFNSNPTNPPSQVTVPPQNPSASNNPNMPQQTPVTAVTGLQQTTATPTPKATATPKPTSSTLKTGTKGSEVKKLQQRLKDLGYYTGSVDGTFGAGTESAVKAFQSNNGLKADGKAGTQTLNKLYSSSAKKAPKATAKPSTSGTGSSKTSSTAYTSPRRTDLYLEYGDTGSDVKYMQNRLITLGYLGGTADGKFGETTQAAVVAFQKKHNLWADGVAGPDTLKKLYSSSAAKADNVAGYLGSLRPGDNGSAVRTLQKNLKSMGYYKGSVDGDYGEGTVTAVKEFQANNGLTPDGIAGKSTLNAIAAAVGTGAKNNGSSGSTSKKGTAPDTYGKTASSNGYTTISNDTKSTSKVTALQSALSATGYYNGALDGSYGGGTASAVSAYQRAKGLRVTGMAGPTTQRLLYGGTSESGSYKKLQLNSTGTAVKNLQYALYELKYYDGNITGTYDGATESAVMVFQQVNGLYVDGVAGQDTQRRLFSSNAKPCDI